MLGRAVLLVVGFLVAAPGCATPLLPDGGPCELERAPVPLPPELRESSGVAPGLTIPRELPGTSLFWTHNDSGWDAEVFGVSPEGEILATVRVAGAENVDWEDMAVGPCEAGRCLYIIDTGDNQERRTDLALYRLPEPLPGDTVSAPADRFPLMLPHGPRDIESLILLPSEEFLLVTKGRSDPVEVYRSPGGLGAPGAPMRMERVQELTGGPVWLPNMVTGAGATSDGALAAVRTYQSLRFYRVERGPEGAASEGGPLVPLIGGLVNLRPVRETQGEAVAFLPGNRLVLTSEAGPGQSQGQLSVLRCELPGWEW